MNQAVRKTRPRLACLCSQMPRRFTGKLCRFLFEHLERGTFGEQLLWLDRRSGVFQLLWKHGNGGSTVPHRDCAVFMAWDQYKTRRRPCKPCEAKQRFRAAMSKMKLNLLEAWGLHEAAKGYQIRRFPRADLNHLLKERQATSRSRPACVRRDSFSDSDGFSTEGSSSDLAKDESPLQDEQSTSCHAAQPESGTLALMAVSEKLPVSLQGDTSAEESEDAHEEVAAVYYGEDLAMDDTGGHDPVNVAQDCSYKEEVINCRCQVGKPQAPRCLSCIVGEYNDPPVIPVFRFDVTVPADSALII
ncbi:uncharacterized protein [Dermacentor albipictus]|uniref:uncharacterized protein isoform X3 n=1 Tax=Dermacentor albipictus TaxID=60249 RepID=UPI0038FC7030